MRVRKVILDVVDYAIHLDAKVCSAAAGSVHPRVVDRHDFVRLGVEDRASGRAAQSVCVMLDLSGAIAGQLAGRKLLRRQARGAAIVVAVLVRQVDRVSGLSLVAS